MVLQLIGGLGFLYIGAEGLVRGSVALALRAGLTRLVVGLTIVAFGTSSPELVVSVGASLEGNSAIAMGNVIGSNICNIALILGLSALVRPVAVNVQVVRLQIPLMIAASCILGLFLLDGVLSRLNGLILVIGIVAYIAYSIYLARNDMSRENMGDVDVGIPVLRKNLLIEIIFVVGGLVLLAVGARLFVMGAVSMAGRLGISQAIIGLTIVALGTSLPELATSMVAAVKKEGDIAVGNVVGSNIFNILAILGLASLIRPVGLGGIGAFDVFVMLGVSLLVLPLARSGFVLNRKEGFVLLLCYAGYILFLMRNLGR